MYPRRFAFLTPKSLSEAIALLSTYGEEAKLLAGGQSLIPLMKLRLASPAYLVDLSGVPGLSYLREQDGHLAMGALTIHAAIEESPLIGARFPLMRDAARTIGDVQVRNMGTIGGAMAHAEPAGDWGAVALALGARIKAQGPQGERVLPAETFFLDAYTSALAPEEVLTEVIFPLPPPRSSGAYLKMVRRYGDFSIVSVGVQLTLDAAGRCQQVGIGIGGAALTPLKATEAEAVLQGSSLDDATVAEAARRAAEATDPLSDIRGSAAYKRELVAALCERALRIAQRRIAGESVEAGHV